MYWTLGLWGSKLVSIVSWFLSENLKFQGGMNERLKTVKIYQLRFWVWEITGKLSEEIFLLGSIKRGSIVYSDYYNNFSQNSQRSKTPHEHTGKKEDSKYLEKSFYHHIKCIVPTFMAAFMWSRPLNSVS